MSGICGIIQHGADNGLLLSIATDMVMTIRHRGPDGIAVWSGDGVALGQTFLHSLPVKALTPAIPGNENGRLRVIFDGHLSNDAMLRKELIGSGHTFSGDDEAEIIAHLYEEVAERCVERLRGSFALAVWDARERTLFLARDRIGEKTLFYAALPNRFLFGSEAKVLLQDPHFTAEPDLIAIHHYLTFQSVPAPFCAFKNAAKLPPAHSLILRDGQCVVSRYWKRSCLPVLTTSGLELEEEILERLSGCIRLHLKDDDIPGAFLSGGVDSSLMVALLATMTGKRVQTFSIGFHEKEYNETFYSRMVAERYGTNHHEVILTPDVQKIFPELVWHYDEPYADSSAIPTFYACREARRFARTVILGDGGDENFAGYARYTNVDAFALQNDYPSAEERVSRFDTSWADFRSGRPEEDRRRLEDLTQQRLLLYQRLTHFHEGYKERLYSADFRRLTLPYMSVDIFLDAMRETDAPDFVAAAAQADFDHYLPDTLTLKVDAAAMAHGLDARAPMLDYEFVQFAARIPSAFKLEDGRNGKAVLKRIAERFLPRELLYRRKMGFGVPIEHWFRTELKEIAYDTLLGKRASERGYFCRPYVEEILTRHQNGESYQYFLWNLLMLESWHNQFIDNASQLRGAQARENALNNAGSLFRNTLAVTNSMAVVADTNTTAMKGERETQQADWDTNCECKSLRREYDCLVQQYVRTVSQPFHRAARWINRNSVIRVLIARVVIWLDRLRGRGALQDFRKCPFFDAAYYLKTYPDVLSAGADPAEHYLKCGAAEGRRPTSWFDSQFYQSRYPDVAESGMNPLLHFYHFGFTEKRLPNLFFSWDLYSGESLADFLEYIRPLSVSPNPATYLSLPVRAVTALETPLFPIVHYIDSLAAGGTERQAALLMMQAYDAGHSVRLAVNQKLEGEAAHYWSPLAKRNIPVIHPGESAISHPELRERLLEAGAANILPFIAEEIRMPVFALAMELIDAPPQVLHAWLDGSNIIAGWAGLLAGVPSIVLSWRSLNPEYFPQFHQPWMRRQYRLLSRHPNVSFIVNSEAGRRSYAEWLDLDPKRIPVIVNGFDEESLPEPLPAAVLDFRRQFGASWSDPVLCAVMRLEEEKRPLWMLSVVAALHREWPRLKVLVAGTGSMAEAMKSEIRRLKLTETVFLLGRCKEIPTLLSASDLFLLTSRVEGLPNVLLEAQWFGCVPVSTSVGGASQAINEVSGCLCSLDDQTDFIETVAQLLRDPDRRKVMSQAGRQWVRSAFPAEQSWRQTLEHYRATLSFASSTCSGD